jgi:hypothetical protein
MLRKTRFRHVYVEVAARDFVRLGKTALKIIRGGRLDRGLVKLANRSVLVLRPRYDVPVNDHDCLSG